MLAYMLKTNTYTYHSKSCIRIGLTDYYIQELFQQMFLLLAANKKLRRKDLVFSSMHLCFISMVSASEDPIFLLCCFNQVFCELLPCALSFSHVRIEISSTNNICVCTGQSIKAKLFSRNNYYKTVSQIITFLLQSSKLLLVRAGSLKFH